VANKINVLKAFVESLETSDASLKSSVLEGIDAYADYGGDKPSINEEDAHQNLETMANEIFRDYDILECRAVCEFSVDGQMHVDIGNVFKRISDDFVEMVNNALKGVKAVEYFDEAFQLDNGMLVLRFKGYLPSVNGGELGVSMRRARDIVDGLAKQEKLRNG